MKITTIKTKYYVSPETQVTVCCKWEYTAAFREVR